MRSDATVTTPAGTVSGGGERTQLFVMPKVCALDVSPCPLLTGAMSPDEGFCRECGVLLGAPLGDAVSARPLPKFFDMEGREFPLRLGKNTVGREGADVMLPDKTVSRRHALIMVEESGAVWMEDTGSTNGTMKSDVPVPKHEKTYLSDGIYVQFGSIRLKVVVPAGGGGVDLDALPALGSGSADSGMLALPGENAPAAVLVGFDGNTHVLTSTHTTFGRRPGNTIVLTGDSYVSGNHAQITFENDKFVLTDLGSTNGTKVNGLRLTANVPCPLSEGDEVTIGQTTFIFHSPTSG